jgi:hypothetical protein
VLFAATTRTAGTSSSRRRNPRGAARVRDVAEFLRRSADRLDLLRLPGCEEADGPAVGRLLATYLSERIWSRFGMEADANWWLDSPDGLEMGGTGFSATLRDYGRFGLFFLNGGVAGGEPILPSGWMREATSPMMLRGGMRLPYGYLWWMGQTPANQRDRVFAGIGLCGQYLYINPAAKVVIVVWGAQPTPGGGAIIDDWVVFDAVVTALR